MGKERLTPAGCVAFYERYITKQLTAYSDTVVAEGDRSAQYKRCMSNLSSISGLTHARYQIGDLSADQVRQVKSALHSTEIVLRYLHKQP